MWLSSSTKEVLAITTVDGKPFAGGKPGPVFRRMWEVFQAKKPKRALTAAEYLSGFRHRHHRAEVPVVEHEPAPLARSQVATSPTKTTWSPARCRAWCRHSNHATQPSISGASAQPIR